MTRANELLLPNDATLIKPEESLTNHNHQHDSQFLPLNNKVKLNIPTLASSTNFRLKKVILQDITAFKPTQFDDIFQNYIDQDITLDKVYMMAGSITERYRSAGYFLSLAYVPDQNIKDGVVVIKVVEGYIGEVEIDSSEAKKQAIIQKLIDELVKSKPLKAAVVESFLLRLNDIPGYTFKGILTRINNNDSSGAVKLTLMASEDKGRGVLTIDNLSSRYLGLYEGSVLFSKSFIPLHQTTVSGLTSIPTNNLNFIALSHSVALAPNVEFEVVGSIAKSKLGYKLKAYDVESSSSFLSGGLSYQLFRQRGNNLSFKLALDGRNSTSKILSNLLTHDQIRALRFNSNFELADSYQGYNTASLTLSRGINGLGSSKKSDSNLSRENANPNFNKVNLSLTRLQSLPNNLELTLSGNAQVASEQLFAVEEFGYGGPLVGRAFESSEIVGNIGVSGGVELRYKNLKIHKSIAVAPNIFFDVGKVWKKNGEGLKSGTSFGIGAKVSSAVGLNLDIGVAIPLMRKAYTPAYTSNNRLKFMVKVSQMF